MTQTKAQLLDGKSATIQFTGGSASAPAISFTGDTNTGIYSPGADQVAISTNGTGRLFVDASGNVGIGGASAGENLKITTSATQTNMVVLQSAGATFGFRTQSAGGGEAVINVFQGTSGGTAVPFAIQTGSVERLRITSDGKLGLGTSSPGTRLQIGSATDISGVDTNALLVIHPTPTSAAALNDPKEIFVLGRVGTSGVSYPASAGFSLSRWENNGISARTRLDLNLASGDTVNREVTVATFLSSGRVGVGTTAPIAQTHIRLSAVTGYTSPSNDGLVLERGGGNDVAISIATDNTRNGYLIFADGDSANPAWVGYDHSANAMSFRVNASERVRIDSSGRLLVGTSSARANFFNGSVSSALQIEGTSNNFSRTLSLVNNSTGDDEPILVFGKSSGSSLGSNTLVSSGNTVGAISFQGNDGTEFVACASIVGQIDGTPGANDMPGRLVFSTTADGASSPTERMRITQDGYIRAGSGGDGIFQGSVFARLTGNVNTGIGFTNFGAPGIGAYPSEANGTATDGLRTLGSSGARWSVVYATTGSINTSDENEKQDIRSLNAAELAVASELKTLIKAFRWKDAVNTKGDEARIHVGVIAQEVQELFAQHGLDVSKYAFWCSDIIYELDGKPATPDENGEYPPEATTRTRLGVRYSELLAFVIAAL